MRDPSIPLVTKAHTVDNTPDTQAKKYNTTGENKNNNILISSFI